ncbi:MAG: hypothetical protein CL534_16170 [Ahrensia sp.]|nr:hypothetical protein [Ahrensia sp.]
MDRNIVIPGHLEIAAEAAGRLNSGEWSTNETLVAALSDLESFVRTPPSDMPFIDAGPLEGFPITKTVVNGFEHVTAEQSSKAPWGYVAVSQLGFVVAAIKALEAQNQHLVRRIAKLEAE